MRVSSKQILERRFTTGRRFRVQLNDYDGEATKKKKWEKKETLGNNMRNCVSLYTLDLSRVPNIRVCMHPV